MKATGPSPPDALRPRVPAIQLAAEDYTIWGRADAELRTEIKEDPPKWLIGQHKEKAQAHMIAERGVASIFKTDNNGDK
jgi:hypothetical protein